MTSQSDVENAARAHHFRAFVKKYEHLCPHYRFVNQQQYLIKKAIVVYTNGDMHIFISVNYIMKLSAECIIERNQDRFAIEYNRVTMFSKINNIHNDDTCIYTHKNVYSNRRPMHSSLESLVQERERKKAKHASASFQMYFHSKTQVY